MGRFKVNDVSSIQIPVYNVTVDFMTYLFMLGIYFAAENIDRTVSVRK